MVPKRRARISQSKKRDARTNFFFLLMRSAGITVANMYYKEKEGPDDAKAFMPDPADQTQSADGPQSEMTEQRPSFRFPDFKPEQMNRGANPRLAKVLHELSGYEASAKETRILKEYVARVGVYTKGGLILGSVASYFYVRRKKPHWGFFSKLLSTMAGSAVGTTVGMATGLGTGKDLRVALSGTDMGRRIERGLSSSINMAIQLQTIRVREWRHHAGVLMFEREDLCDNRPPWHFKVDNHFITLPAMQVPWMRSLDTKSIKNPTFEQYLSMELECFSHFISPTDIEKQQRDEAIARVSHLIVDITNNWIRDSRVDDVKVIVHGSSATQLYLPDADVDLVVSSNAIGYMENSYLFHLANEIRAVNGIRSVQYIPASVPIIKLVDARTNIPFDISTRNPFPRTVEWVEAVCKEEPRIYPVALYIKLFCVANRIEQPFTGGLGGLTIVVMIVTLIRLYHNLKPDKHKRPTLGDLLLSFFAYYDSFDYRCMIDCGSAPIGHRPADIKPKSFQMSRHEVVFLHPLDECTCISSPTKLYAIQPVITRARWILEGIRNHNVIVGQSVLVQLLNGLHLGNLARRQETRRMPAAHRIPPPMPKPTIPVLPPLPAQVSSQHSNGRADIRTLQSRPMFKIKGVATPIITQGNETSPSASISPKTSADVTLGKRKSVVEEEEEVLHEGDNQHHKRQARQ
ncbi:hypothetical protein SeLEV6574_g04126 [Synchytrium endobioticum]|uniref:Poly(A) RNA polymerase mitochondrial-like central palm domain-containing protein n=1 Tax=Synchytrium endobioticum TaxID=286115 RepID=A0A507D0S3_9FUNG|nr:hypothetical protein SeLEV6574_g04126 [Synchytrium endobioticum]